MKAIYLLICCIGLGTAGWGQSPVITYSMGFREPQALAVKVLQCTNGNTFLFSFLADEGINVKLFGKDRKATGETSIKSKLYDVHLMEKAHIHGIYELHGEVVIFLEQLKDKVPTLYRTSISTTDGHLIAEEKVMDLPGYIPDRGYVKLFGLGPAIAFHVAKDPIGDHYSVLAFNGLAADDPNRIKWVLFNGEHQEVAKAFYHFPAIENKQQKFIGLCMGEDRKTYLASYLFTKEADQGEIVLTSFQDNLVHREASGIHKDFKNTRGTMVWNAGTRKIMLLTMTYLENTKRFYEGTITNNYRATLSSFDEKTLALVASRNISTMPVTSYKNLIAGNKDDYEGMPVALTTNRDHTTTITLENIQSTTNGNSMMGAPGAKSFLGDVGVINVDDSLQGTNGYYIPMQQDVHMMVTPMAVNDRQSGNIYFHPKVNTNVFIDPGYYSVDCIPTKGGTYIVFNDLNGNFKKSEGQKRINVVAISETNTALYRLADNTATRMYLFGKPDGTFQNRFANIASASYDSATGIYAVLMVEKAGSEKQARIA